MGRVGNRMGTSINRNIVECKCKVTNGGKITWNSINRNIVECKLSSADDPDIAATVLIETLWNVNLLVIVHQENSVSRINRNIVECK